MPVSNLVSLTGTTPTSLVIAKPNTMVKVKRVMVYNGDTAAHRVQLGMVKANPDGTIDTSQFTQILPDIPVAAGQVLVLEVPPAYVYSSQTDKTAVFNALAARIEATATAPVQVVVEYEEG